MNFPNLQAVQWETLTVATANVLNLANAGRTFYANQDPYSASEFERKVTWLGERIQTLNADVLAVQEIWDEAALKAAVGRSGLHYAVVVAPGAENNAVRSGALGTPCVGLVTRLALESVQSHPEFAAGQQVNVPDIGEMKRFERAPLHAVLRMKHGQRLHVITAHLKSKRPKFLQDADGNALEDRDDPKLAGRATLRSLVIRGAEAVALRALVIDILAKTREPLVVMGDFNDGPHSVTTQIVAATNEIAYDKAARDTAMFNAYEVQSMPLRRDVGFSHIHQGSPETLDPILVSEEFVPGSKFSLGDVRRVEYFNDHLHEGKNRCHSDHGFVRATLRLRGSGD